MSTATPAKARQAAPLPAPAEYLDNAAAAAWLGVSPERLRQSRSIGKLCGVPAPSWLKLGTKRRVRYRVETLRAWMAENATECAPVAKAGRAGS